MLGGASMSGEGEHIDRPREIRAKVACRKRFMRDTNGSSKIKQKEALEEGRSALRQGLM